MKDERVEQIARAWLDEGLHPGMEKTLVAAIRLALAERDREVAEWAKVHHRDFGEYRDQCVELSHLLAFLEAQP